MKTNWIKYSENKILLLVVFLLVLKIISIITGGPEISRYTEPFVLTAILLLFIKKYPKISILLKGFIFFALLGNIAGLFDLQFRGIHFETIAYCLGYLCLVNEAVFKIKKVKINFVIGMYLVFVFTINAYFIYVLYEIFKDVVLNNLELSLIVVRLVSLLLFALFSFTLYLSSESRQSILLLLMSISLIFSDVLFLIDEYYLYYWIFDFLSKSLYLITFYCFYLYITAFYKAKTKPKISKALS